MDLLLSEVNLEEISLYENHCVCLMQAEQYNGMNISTSAVQGKGTRKILICNVLHTKFLASFLWITVYMQQQLQGHFTWGVYRWM